MTVIYLNNVVVIYPDKTVIIYPNKAANLLELKNQRGVQLSHPEIFKRLGGIAREAADRPIHPGVNRKPQVKVKGGRHTSGSWPALLKRKLEGFKLILELIRDNKKAVTVKAKVLREKARAEQNGWNLRGGTLVRYSRLWVPGETRRAWLIKKAHARPGVAHYGANKLRKVLSAQYYWRGLGADCTRYVANYRIYRRITVPRNKTPGLLRPLPVPDRPWQHMAINFKNFPKDAQGYNAVCVVINRLTKRIIILPITRKIIN